MSTSNRESGETTSRSITESNVLAVVEDLQERVCELEDEKKVLEDKVSQLESENERLQEQVDENTSEVSDIDSVVRQNTRKRAKDRGRISELETRVDELEEIAFSTEDDSTPSLEDGFSDEFTQIEEISIMDYDDIEDEMGSTTKRAVAIFQNWKDWSESVPKGRVKRTADNLRELLQAELDERIESKQVMRACRKLHELSDGKILLGEHQRHGKQLLQPKKYDFVSLTKSSA
jgi:hypothetical protein